MLREAKEGLLAVVLTATAALALAPGAAATPTLYATDAAPEVTEWGVAPDGALTVRMPGSIATASGPRGIVVSPDGRSAYVASSGNPTSTISQYDIALDGTLSAKTPPTAAAGNGAGFTAITPDGKSFYAVNNGSSTVSQYDISPMDGTLTPKSTPTVNTTGTNPASITVSPDGKSAYVGNLVGATVTQYDISPTDGSLSPKTPDHANAIGFPFSIAVSPDGNSAYVVNESNLSVSQYDIDSSGHLSAKTPAAVSTSGNLPFEIEMTPDGRSAYVTNMSSATIAQFDVNPTDGTLSAKTPATVGTGMNPLGLAVSPDGKHLYVAAQNSSKIYEYDISTTDGTLTAKAPASVSVVASPQEVAIAPDLVAPTVSIDSGPSGPGSSADATFTFSSDEAGSSFACSLDGATLTACSSPQAYSGLTDGGHSFAVKSTDFSGNTGMPATRLWSVDTTPPTATVDSGPPALTNSRDASFSFSATEAGTFECSLDGAAFGACSSPQGYTGLADGSHSFAVRATDSLSNAGSPTSRTWTIDATAPQTTITAGPKARTRNRRVKLKFSSSEPSSIFQCSLDKKPFAPCSSPDRLNVRRGRHNFKVRATDQAGNADPSAAVRKWKVRKRRTR